MFDLIQFSGELLVLFFLSRNLTTHLFHFFRLFTKNNHVIFFIISLLYFPGTLLHEMSHYLVAVSCMLKVTDIRIFPVIQSGMVRLGSVSFERKDSVRSIIVGIAPIAGGMLFFYVISVFSLFPSHSFPLMILIIYLIFSVSSTMFSSKKDMGDLLYAIPFLLLIGAAVYFAASYNARFYYLVNEQVGKGVIQFIQGIHKYIIISIMINSVFLICAKAAIRVWRKP